MNTTSDTPTVALVVVSCLALVVAGIVPVAATAPDRTTASGAITDDAIRQSTADGGGASPAADLTPIQNGVLNVTNDNLVLYVGTDGRFTLQTADDEGNNVDLLYGSGSPGTSYLTVVVDGTTYTTGSNMSSYITGEPTVTGESIVTEWTLPGDVVVTQTITLEGELATFDVSVENDGSAATDVRTRFLFDYQVADEDGSPVWLGGQVINTETSFDDPAFDSWKTYDQVPTPTFTGQARLLTQPDRVAFTQWGSAYRSPYEYTVTPGAEFYNLEYGSGDSAGLLYFDLGSVAPGASASAATQYGVGEPGSATETLNLAFDDQSTPDGASVTVGSVFLPDPGFLGVYADDGTLLGSSAYLTAGSHENVLVNLSPPITASQPLTAVPFRDSDGDQQPDLDAGDEPYTADGERVTQVANVTLGSAPTADAGVDRSVTEGDDVTLYGTGSSDPEGTSLTYEWSQTGGPDVSLSGADTATPGFTAPDVDSPTGLTFELTVTDEQGNSDTDAVVVTVVPEDVGPEPDPTATVTFDNQTSDGTTVTVGSVTVSEGGFVAIHDGTDGGIGPVIGVSEYLPAGTHEDVEVTLFDVPGGNFSDDATLENGTLIAMPHLDTNGNETYDFVSSNGEADGPYTANGSAVVDPAYITVEPEPQPEPETVYYQVDFVAGEPLDQLGGDAPLYAEQDRLLRFAHGNTDEGITQLGSAWASADVREAVDYGHIATHDNDDTAHVHFTVADGENVTLSLAVYEKPGPGFDPAETQTLLDASTETFGPGEHTITVDLPDETDSDDGNATAIGRLAVTPGR